MTHSGTGLVLAYDGGFPEEFRRELEPIKDGQERLHFAGLPLRDILAPYESLNFDEQFGKGAEKLIRLYRLGKGRVVVLDYGAFCQVGWGGYHLGYYSLTPELPRDREGGEAFNVKLRSMNDTTATRYEYSLMLVARAILWAIPGKTPPGESDRVSRLRGDSPERTAEINCVHREIEDLSNA